MSRGDRVDALLAGETARADAAQPPRTTSGLLAEIRAVAETLLADCVRAHWHPVYPGGPVTCEFCTQIERIIALTDHGEGEGP